MIRSLISRASAALACGAMVLSSMVFVAAPAQAANITFSDPNCSSFSVTGTAPNFTLVCATLACSIAASPSSPSPSQNVQLTANCTPAATSVTWNLVSSVSGCPAASGVTTNPMTLAAPGTSVSGCVYQVAALSGALAGQAQTTINWSSAPPAAPSGCTLGASTTSLPIGGGTVTLTATCTGGGAPTSYAWTGNSLPTPTTTNVATTNITSTTTFTVTPSNATGNGNTASVTVNVAGSSLGPLCSPFSNVLPVVTATWGSAANWQSVASGNFGDGSNTVWVFRLVVPPGTPTSSVTGRFTVSEFAGPTTFRQMTISTQACDFRNKDYTGINGPLAVSNGTTASVSFGVSTPFIFGPAGLSAGQTYYVNVRNWQLDPSPQNSCAQTTCNALMSDDPATP
jgi:hypothetical protein